MGIAGRRVLVATVTMLSLQLSRCGDHFLDKSPDGLLGKLRARGGQAQRVAEAIKAGAITIEPLTPRHDSQAYVVVVQQRSEPSLIGLFHGVTYDDTPDTYDADNSVTPSATERGTSPAPGVIWIKRTYRNYPFVKPAYDDKVDDVRDAVDRYVWPDGINLIVSIRLDRLQQLIFEWNGKDFPAFRTEVLRFTGGAAPPPAVGELTDEDRQEITNNRAWRDLVDDKVRRRGERVRIKTDLPGQL